MGGSDRLHGVKSAVTAFAASAPGRRVAVRALRGPRLGVGANADQVTPSASLIKLPLAVTVWDAAQEAGHLSLDTTIPRHTLGQTAYPSIIEVVQPERELSVRELIGIMLSTSDNPIAQYLLGLVGMEAVTATARRLGAKHTIMAVGFADEELGAAGRASVTTANDMIEMFAAVAGEPRYRSLVHAMRNSMRNFRIPLRLPDELYVAHKTGSLVGVVNDAGILYGREVDLAAAFLTDGQVDSARTSIDIGDCVAAIWSALGETPT